MTAKPALDELFEHSLTYPDPIPQERLARLVGLDDHKTRATKILGVLINPSGIETWARKHYSTADRLLDLVLRRPPLLVFAGDVGSGKTELAECIGDTVARQERLKLNFFPLAFPRVARAALGK
jgi:hypothetical protein